MGGIQIGVSHLLANVPVANGLFTVLLNAGGQFGANAFNGEARWLQIEVCADAGCGTLTILAPRQPITPTPYAVTALSTVGIDGHSLNAADGSPTNALSVDNNGNVGIGETNATARLHVAGPGNASPLIVENGAGVTLFEVDQYDAVLIGNAATESALMVSSTTPAVYLRRAYSNGFGNPLALYQDHAKFNMPLRIAPPLTDNTSAAQLDVESFAATVAIFNRTSTDGTLVAFQQDSVIVGSITVAGTTVSYNAFTGSHYGWMEGTLERGTLVSMTGENRRNHQEPESEIIYGISPTVVPNDPRCLGAYLALQEPSQASSDENPHLIMAVGNGEMWVVDRGRGDLQPGDALISSDVSGCAMKDDPARFPVGHVVARAAEAVRWAQVTQTTPDGVKRKKISVLLDSFVRGLGDERLIEQIRAQQNEIDELKRRMAQMEAAFPRSTH